MSSYVFTTNNPTVAIVGTGNNADDAKANATQAAGAMQGVELTGQQEFNHSVVINLAITILNKAKADEVLIRKLFERFGNRAKFEIRNDINEDGSVRKHFYINDQDKVHLDLKNKMQADSYEDKGLSEEHLNAIFDRLEYFVAKDEIVISATGNTEINVPIPDGEKPVLDVPATTDEVHAE